MPCGNDANLKHTLENVLPPFAVLLVLLLVMYLKRQEIKKLRNKYGNVLRDMLRIVTINFSYAQINSSLPLVLTVPWPQEYLVFLNKLSFVNLDIGGMVANFLCKIRIQF